MKTSARDQLLELVMEYPCLWDRRDAHYLSKKVKHRCRTHILEIINKSSKIPVTMSQLKDRICYTQRKLYRQIPPVKPSTNDDHDKDQQIPPTDEESPAMGEKTKSNVLRKKSPRASSSVTTSQTTSNDKEDEDIVFVDFQPPPTVLEGPMTKKRTHDSDQVVAKQKKRHDVKVPDVVDISKTISNVKSPKVVKNTLRSPEHLNTGSRPGKSGGKSAVVTKLALCRICLTQKEQLMLITNTELQRVYQKLTLLPFLTSDARPPFACLMCINLLRKAHKLMVDSLQAEEWLSYTLAGVDLNKTIQPSSSKLSVVKMPSLTISSETMVANESIDINEGSVGERSKKDSAVCNSEDTSLLIQCGISDNVVPKTEYIPASDEQKSPGHSDDGHLVYDVVKVEPRLQELVVFNYFSDDDLGQTDQQMDDNAAKNAFNTERTIERVNAYSNLDSGSKEVERDLRHVYSFGIHVNMKAEPEDEKSTSESPNSDNVGKARIVAPKSYLSMDSKQPYGTNDEDSDSDEEVLKIVDNLDRD